MSHVLLAPKPDRSLCYCILYRRLNYITIRDKHVPSEWTTKSTPGGGELVHRPQFELILLTGSSPREVLQKDDFHLPIGHIMLQESALVLINALETFQREMYILLSRSQFNT